MLGQNYIFLGNFALYDRWYYIFFLFFLWRWRGGGGFIVNIFIFIFIFFYGGASHITGGGCGGLIFFKRSGLFFIFIFFYGGGRTSLGEGGVGKIKCPRRGPIFFCFFFFAGGGGVVAEKIWGGVEGKAKGRKKPRGQITCDDVVRKVWWCRCNVVYKQCIDFF